MTKKRWIVFVGLFLGTYFNGYTQNPELVEQYINRFKDLAMSEQARVGIPAAVTLAQGIHETGAGTSELAVKGNNHFGIKCKRGWKGMTMKHTDDRPNECFRKYTTAIESYKDHSDYLKNNPRYASLFKLSTTDYAAWCIGLRRAGYATNPRYAQMLIKLIENYKLQEYTYAAMGNNEFSNAYAAKRENEVIPETPPVVASVKEQPAAMPVVSTPPTPVVTKRVSSSGIKVAETRTTPVSRNTTPSGVVYGKPIRVNGLRAVYAQKGQSPLEYAIKNSIRYNRLLEINELEEGALKEDMYLYLERKHFRGVRPMHMVKPGESVHSISQKEGIQTKYLRELNFLLEGEEPVPGVVLELQSKAKEKPRVVAATKAKEPEGNKRSVANSYVKTKKTGIPSNPRYVPERASTPPVSTTTPKVVSQPVNTPPQRNTSIRSSSDNAVSKQGEGDIDALKSKFDNVIYSNDKVTKSNTSVPTNPRYIPQSERKESTTVVSTAKPSTPVSKSETVPTKTVQQPTAAPVPPAATPEKVTTTSGGNYVEKKVRIPVKAKKKTKKQKKKIEEAATPIIPPKPVTKEPQSEIDKLKAQFDAVVYDNKSNTSKSETTSKEKSESTSIKQPEEKDPTKYYTVKEGDTAFSIAKKHKITMRQLMDWNDLDFDAIKTGMKLKVKQ